MAQPAYVSEAIFAVDDALLEVEAERHRAQQEADEQARADAEAKRRLQEQMDARRNGRGRR